MEKLGVGYCSRGLMKGHIAIPIHSVHGELLAYARCPIADKKEGVAISTRRDSVRNLRFIACTGQ